MRNIRLLVVATMLVAGTAAYAHHSYTATYDTGHQGRLWTSPRSSVSGLRS
jgi:hypothetical protein